MSKQKSKSPKWDKKLPKIYCSLNPKVSVIIPVKNEKSTIVEVIQQVSQVHRDTEVIVVSNGTTDGTDILAEKVGAIVIREKDPLGQDVGRYVGASVAKGEILLFLDGDFVIPYQELLPFVDAIESGEADIALNQYEGALDKKTVHSVVLAKYALNIALSRPDLKGCSLTTVPHAMSKYALQRIGLENLMVPPIAHMIAIREGLHVLPVHYIDVSVLNSKRTADHRVAIKKLIVGDHVEAMYWLTQLTNMRGAMTDLKRQRKKVEEV